MTLVVQVLAPGTPNQPMVRAASSPPSIPSVCTGLTLQLRPGVLDAEGALKIAALSDIPLDPVAVPVPLQPGSTISSAPLPIAPAIPPVLLARQYLKTAVAEYAVPSGVSTAVKWYKARFARCGYTLRWWTTGSNGKGGPTEEDYGFESPTIPSLTVRLSFEQSSSGNPLLLYYAYAESVPPPPAASHIGAAVNHIRVTYVFPNTKQGWKIDLTNQTEIAAITGTINRLSQDVGVHSCFGSRQSATLRMVQPKTSQTFTVSPGCYDVWFGRRVRLLDGNHAVWNAVRAAVYNYCLGHRCKRVNV